MTDKEKTLAFIEERIKWNEDMLQCDPKPSDIGRIEEAKCIRRFINSLQKEPVSKDLEEASNNALDKISKKYDIVNIKSCLEMFRLGTEWQKKHLWKDAQGNDLPEYEREVVVFTQNFPDNAGMMMVAIGHRPTPEGYDGKSLATGEIKHYTPKTYDKGGWNIPDVKYWLDVELPKEMEE